MNNQRKDPVVGRSDHPAAQRMDGSATIAVIMITLNEGHHMEAVCKNLHGFAHEIFIVDSYSQDNTVDIALKYGAHVVQRRFRGFGDQWNFALRELPIHSTWVMKLDPDERLTPELKSNIQQEMQCARFQGLSLNIRLCFMGKTLPMRSHRVRVWQKGCCEFTSIAVNEHIKINGKIARVDGDLLHLDSPNLFHWFEKQNRYTTAEAKMAYLEEPMAMPPKLLGSNFQRRMWLKKNYSYFPGCYLLIFFYHWLVQGAWRAGWAGFVWARLRSDVMRFIVYKRREMQRLGCVADPMVVGAGTPDSRVLQYE